MWVERFSAVPDSDQETTAYTATLFADDNGALLEGAFLGRRVLHLDEGSIKGAFQGETDLSLLTLPPKPPRRIIILVHGFEFEPRVGWMDDAHDQPNPHHAIFHNRAEVGASREKRTHNTPWLTRLAPEDGDLVIPFAYASDPGRLAVDLAGDDWSTRMRRQMKRVRLQRQLSSRFVNLFGYSYAQAGLYGSGLAALIAMLAAQWPGAAGPPIHIVGHSLGARVVTSALTDLTRDQAGNSALQRVSRVILMAAALARHQVQELAKAYKAAGLKGQGPEFFNFTSASDMVLRLVGARLSHAMAEDLAASKAVQRIVPSYFRSVLRPNVSGVDGAGRWAKPLRWIDIPLDHPRTRKWGLAEGISLAGDYRHCSMDHWVHFTHEPNWQLYRHILSGDAAWSVHAIRTGKGPNGQMLRVPLRAAAGTNYRIVAV